MVDDEGAIDMVKDIQAGVTVHTVTPANQPTVTDWSVTAVQARIVAHPVEYRYSSVRNYFLNDHSVLVVDLDGVTGLESVSSRNGP